MNLPWLRLFLGQLGHPKTWLAGVGVGALLVIRGLDRGALLWSSFHGLAGFLLDVAGHSLIGVVIVASAVASYQSIAGMGDSGTDHGRPL